MLEAFLLKAMTVQSSCESSCPEMTRIPLISFSQSVVGLLNFFSPLSDRHCISLRFPGSPTVEISSASLNGSPLLEEKRNTTSSLFFSSFLGWAEAAAPPSRCLRLLHIPVSVFTYNGWLQYVFFQLTSQLFLPCHRDGDNLLPWCGFPPKQMLQL